jgi:hypothetical protein
MIHEKLAEIQQKLKAPKEQLNKFGGYKYRSCEDILEAVKPLLGDAVITLDDEMQMIGNRYYVRARAILHQGDASIQTIAYAREEETKKGMDASQITGAASSYARKYALNGLLLIDDTKDADHTNTGQEQVNKPTTMPQSEIVAPVAKPASVEGKNQVSEAQLKRLFSLANKSDKTKADIVEWLGNIGMSSSKELNKEQYEELCVWIQAPKVQKSAIKFVKCPDGQERPEAYCSEGCPNDTCTGQDEIPH